MQDRNRHFYDDIVMKRAFPAWQENIKTKKKEREKNET